MGCAQRNHLHHSSKLNEIMLWWPKGLFRPSGVPINLATAICIIQRFIFNVIIYLKEKKRTHIALPLLTSAAGRLFTLYLNPFFIAISLDNPVHVDAGYVDVLFGKSPNIHHLLHLRREAQR